MSDLVYLNGQYLPVEEAKISIFDRGFIFGDGAYEVIPVYGDHIFRFAEHVTRLNKSLEAIYIDQPYAEDEWEKILNRLLDVNTREENSSLYIQVTRGISAREHVIDNVAEQTTLAILRPWLKTDHSSGISAIVTEDIRWKYCDIKAITLLPNILLRHKARQSGAEEAILIRDGYLTEGAASSVFIATDGIVKTPVKDGSILSGITRDLLVRLLKESDIPCREIPIKESELWQADEIWLTSSTWELTPVIRLDAEAVGTGLPGNIWRRASNIYQQFKKETITDT